MKNIVIFSEKCLQVNHHQPLANFFSSDIICYCDGFPMQKVLVNDLLRCLDYQRVLVDLQSFGLSDGFYESDG